MLRVCTNSDVSICSSYEILSEEHKYIFLKINNLKVIEIKDIVDAIIKMLSNFDDDEYIALKAESFFDSISECNVSVDEYIINHDDCANIQFIEQFIKSDEYDDEDYDDYDDEEEDYDNYIDVDSIDDISDDCTYDYKVRFIKNNDTISIQISNDISMIDMTLLEFLSLYK
jgi:hypothetical protein